MTNYETLQSRYQQRPGGPYFNAEEIIPADSDLDVAPMAIYVGGTGDVVATMAKGEKVTISAVPAGTILPICPKQVNAATTATKLLVLY